RDHLDRRPAVVDVDVDVTVEIRDVEELLEVIRGDLALLLQALDQVGLSLSRRLGHGFSLLAHSGASSCRVGGVVDLSDVSCIRTVPPPTSYGPGSSPGPSSSPLPPVAALPVRRSASVPVLQE